MRTLAGWCVRHRRIVVLLWLLVLVTSIFTVEAVGTDYSNNFNFPHTQSSDAINLLKSVAPAHSGDTEEVVFGTSGGTRLTDPDVGQRINTMVDKINALPNVTAVTSPYDAAGNLVNTTNINADQTVGFFQVPFDKQPNNLSSRRGQDVRPRRHQDVGRRADGRRHRATGRTRQQPVLQQHRSRRVAGVDRVAPHLRIVLRRLAADHLRAVRAWARPSASSAC